MEIERKYLIQKADIPFRPEDFPCRHIEQGYLCTEPVVRIRQDNAEYVLTYKSRGLMVREEYNLPLTEASYRHLREKTDGRLIVKDRYMIPLSSPVVSETSDLMIELDFFHADLEGLILAEVEFPDKESAERFVPPSWFGEDVTYSAAYHNSTLSRI